MWKWFAALIGALIGLAFIEVGFAFHIGDWRFEGALAFAGAALAGAIIAFAIASIFGKEFW